jgi:lipopolysaccharide transport system ATP-binding protein
MNKEYIIEVEGISKKYFLGETKSHIFQILKNRKYISSTLKNEIIHKSGRMADNATFWALKNVSFSVSKGDVLGIIGKNGAGKSTLLKILSRITAPTSGKIKLKGRVASLLEVGTGFHPDLTGIENIYLNGAILGLTKLEIKKQIDGIIDFAGIPHHINSPVKRYSSGMKVRLGFAVAAHLDPEILIVDEVLSVGDAEFQAKCLGRIKEVTNGGRTVLFVSHNMAAVRTLCTNAILLIDGQIETIGNTVSVIESYLDPKAKQKGVGEITWSIDNAPGGEEVTLLSVRTLNEKLESAGTFYTSSPILIEITYKIHQQLSGSRMLIQLRDSFDVIAFTSTNQLDDKHIKLPGVYITTCTILPNLLNQATYNLFIHMGIPNMKPLINNVSPLSFNTILMGNNGSLQDKWPGILAPLLKWKTIKKE